MDQWLNYVGVRVILRKHTAFACSGFSSSEKVNSGIVTKIPWEVIFVVLNFAWSTACAHAHAARLLIFHMQTKKITPSCLEKCRVAAWLPCREAYTCWLQLLLRLELSVTPSTLALSLVTASLASFIELRFEQLPVPFKLSQFLFLNTEWAFEIYKNLHPSKISRYTVSMLLGRLLLVK